MNPNCESYFNLINEHLDGSISLEDAKILSYHLKICRKCSQELKDLKQTLDLVASIKDIKPPKSPDSFVSDIIDSLEKEKQASKFRFSFTHYAAATIIGLLLVGFIVVNFQPRSTAPFVAVNKANDVSSGYQEDIVTVLNEDNSSVIAEAGLPTDQWGLLDIDSL